MNKLLFSIALLSILSIGCQEDDPIPNPDGSFPESIELSGTQSAALTLTNHITDPSVPDYCVSGTYFIQADVVVEPGVTILMKNGSKIHVQNDGSFKSVGTESEKITIKGENSFLAGQWANIHFSTKDLDNQLVYTNITGGGNTTTYNAMVFIGFQGYALIDNCNINYSSSNGIMTESSAADLGGISNSDISICGLYPIHINSRQVGAIASSNTGGGNENDLIQVESSQLQNPVTWHKSPFPYRINGSLGIATDLTVEPGARFFFAQGARIEIVTDGSMNCIGTEDDNIVFRGETSSAGAWEAIIITGSMNTLNRFEYCEFSYGGGNATYQGMITLWLNAYARIGNSTIMNSERYGVFNNNNSSTFIDDGNNTWGGNALGDIGN